MNRVTAHYIIRFHDDLMTDVERRVQGLLFAAMKATVGRSDPSAQNEARAKNVFSPYLSDD